jgi:hypothetical protein
MAATRRARIVLGPFGLAREREGGHASGSDSPRACAGTGWRLTRRARTVLGHARERDGGSRVGLRQSSSREHQRCSRPCGTRAAREPPFRSLPLTGAERRARAAREPPSRSLPLTGANLRNRATREPPSRSLPLAGANELARRVAGVPFPPAGRRGTADYGLDDVLGQVAGRGDHEKNGGRHGTGLYAGPTPAGQVEGRDQRCGSKARKRRAAAARIRASCVQIWPPWARAAEARSCTSR